MRINLRCPYSEKDQAKALGARWDAARKVWHIENVEDLMPFMRWIPKQEPAKERITLARFMAEFYGDAKSLTYESAKAFGIPYPLPRGWHKTYAKNTANFDDLTFGRKKKRQNAKARKKKDHALVAITEGEFKPLCECKTPPWEHCPHTEALEAEIAEAVYGLARENTENCRTRRTSASRLREMPLMVALSLPALRAS